MGTVNLTGGELLQPREKPYSANNSGLRLRVRLTPRANRNAVEGLVQDAQGQTLLQLRLKAPPVEGAANKALMDFLASELRLRKSDVEIVAGAKSRVKTLQLSGVPRVLAASLDKLLQNA